MRCPCRVSGLNFERAQHLLDESFDDAEAESGSAIARIAGAIERHEYRFTGFLGDTDSGIAHAQDQSFRRARLALTEPLCV